MLAEDLERCGRRGLAGNQRIVDAVRGRDDVCRVEHRAAAELVLVLVLRRRRGGVGRDQRDLERVAREIFAFLPPTIRGVAFAQRRRGQDEPEQGEQGGAALS